MKFQIKSRWDASVIFECKLAEEFKNRPKSEQLGEAVKKAVSQNVSLVGASLDGARLNRASLVGASLVGASLVGASLTPIRDDIWAVLSAAPAEVPALIAALQEGRVDGSTYSGECACLIGTLENAHEGIGILPYLCRDAERPAERFFMAIKKGDTPETNQFSALALQWAEEWLANMRAAFGGNQ